MHALKTLITLICITVCIQLSSAEDVWPEWPDPKSFSEGGQGNQFRLPFFKDFYAYPNGEPLYNVLYLPDSYDPERSYPLAIAFQPQNGAPSHWFMKNMTSGDAIVLGISWSLKDPDHEANFKLTVTGAYHIPATVYWLQKHFKIDQKRIFVGGFSAAGWSATSEAMTTRFRNISTHFVITGAGIRGNPVYKWFEGNSVFVAAGTNDMNYDSAKRANATLGGLKYDVTYFEEPGVGHQVGPKMKVEMVKWYDSFSAKKNADVWLAEAEKLIAAGKNGMEPGCNLLASVATLGPNHELGKKARQRLEDLEGDALKKAEAAWQLLYQGHYSQAGIAFKEAGKLAKKQKSIRLMKWCLRGIDEISERQMVEQITLLDQCEYNDRAYQAYMLCADGEKRFGKAMKDKGGDLFKNSLKFFEKLVKESKKPSKERMKAQKDLIGIRMSIWSGKGIKDEKATNKTRAALEKLIASVGDAPEKREANELLVLLPVYEKESGLFGE